jgi:hypothetical protein
MWVDFIIWITNLDFHNEDQRGTPTYEGENPRNDDTLSVSLTQLFLLDFFLKLFLMVH